MLSRARIVTYDTAQFPFARLLEARVYKVRALSKLHQAYRAHKRRRSGSAELTYQDNLALRELMQNQPDDSALLKLYRSFVLKVISPLYGGKISYSNRPKMRVHLAGTPSVSKWHRDVDVTGRVDQINAFLPFTDCAGTASLWCESNYGREDYQPIELKYGQIYLFDGGYLTHGTVANRSTQTRVSLDFRFTPLAPSRVEPPWSGILAGRSPELQAEWQAQWQAEAG